MDGRGDAPPPVPGLPVPRLQWLDAARGLAVAAMIVFHFSWDLRYFGYIAVDVGGELGWRIFARSIAGSFLFLSGVSLALATLNGINWQKFLRRLAVIVAAALAITIVTRFAFPDSFIFFGILHAIAVSSVLGLLFVRAPALVSLAAAVFCFAVPHLFAAPAFNAPALLWLGLNTIDPRSNDFVPLLPWFGVFLAGIAAARLLLKRLPALQARVAAPRALVWAGRRSLAIYLLHQPLLFGLTFLAAQIHPPSFSGFEPAFLQSCTSTCGPSDAEFCRRTCSCIIDRTKQAGLWADVMSNRLDEQETARYFAFADACRAAAAPQQSAPGGG